MPSSSCRSSPSRSAPPFAAKRSRRSSSLAAFWWLRASTSEPSVALALADLQIPVVPFLPPVDDVQRIGVDHQGALRRLRDVEQLQRLRGGRPQDNGRALVITRAMAGALEEGLLGGERDRAPEMGALAVRGDDAARRVQQEEAALTEEDRTIVRRRELLQDLARRADRDRRAETDDTRDAQVRRDRRRKLGRAESDS